MAKKKTVKKPVKKKSVKKKSVKKKKPPVQDELATMRLEMMGKDPKTIAAADAVWDAIQNSRADFVFADVFERCSCPTLRIQWACDKFWYNYVMTYGVPALEACYSKLIAKGVDSEKSSKVFNDGDEQVWTIADPKKKDRRILIHKGQSHRILFVWDASLNDGIGEIHVRRFFDRYSTDKTDTWSVQEEEEFKKGVLNFGYEWAIREADKLSDYADDIQGNAYPERLSLQHYIDNDFEMQYGDARDKGYLISAQGMFPDTGGTLTQHVWLKVIWDCLVSNLVSELYPCGFVEFLNQRFDSKGKLITTKKTTEDA